MDHNIEFTPTSEFTDWLDGVDRVSASGDNGFNVRFRALQDDLTTLATRVRELNAAINDGRDDLRHGLEMLASPSAVFDAWSVSMPLVDDNDFFFRTGWAIIEGTPIYSDWSTPRYSEQPLTDPDLADAEGVPVIQPLTTPDADRDDLVYLDSWEREEEINGTRRLVRKTAVRVQEGGGFLVPVPGHLHLEVAILHRRAGQAQITAEQIEDVRRTYDRGPAERVLGLAPLFHPEAFSGWTGWRHTFRVDNISHEQLVAAKDTAERTTGFLPINLPSGARRIRAVVQCRSTQTTGTGPPLTLALKRRSFDLFAPTTLASDSVPHASGGFERTLEAPADLTIDNQFNSYYLYAWCDSGSSFQIDGVSVFYTF